MNDLDYDACLDLCRAIVEITARDFIMNTKKSRSTKCADRRFYEFCTEENYLKYLDIDGEEFYKLVINKRDKNKHVTRRYKYAKK